jgi:S-formylglutathione hydrolase FrmB
MGRWTSTACGSIGLLLIVGTGHASGDQELKKAWHRANRSLKEAGTETGHAFRDTAKNAGHEAKVAAKKVGGATREASADARADGKHFWTHVKRDFAAALDRFSNALGRTTHRSD